MSKKTNRVQAALGERPQPVGEIFFGVDGRRQASVFRYAVEWLDSPEEFVIAPSMPESRISAWAGAWNRVSCGVRTIGSADSAVLTSVKHAPI